MSADDRAGTSYNYRTNNRGRIDRLTIGSTVTADYVYDGLERMALRTTQNMSPAGTTHYVYDLAGHLIVEADDTGATLREYIWLYDTPLAVVADGRADQDFKLIGKRCPVTSDVTLERF